ncbi:MAG TPA: hypothetical protein VLZ05_28975 [Mycobacterium sp.]|nr:hypothetical protein [Mycobacterium sp.]HUH72519.1 hypothetical protein [Mycobacterium sp.]
MNVFDAAAAAVRRLPGGGLSARGIEFVGAVVEGAEREVFRYLRYRLDEIASATAPHRQDVAMVSASALMAELLERSVMQDTKSSKADWHAAVLSQLVPDEARVIAALAEASAPVPLLHVLPRSGRGRLLENASLIGRTAALTLPAMTPVYVTHLRALGLVETGPEDEDNLRGYELLLADKAVRAALKEGAMGKLPARVLRRTLMLSQRGRELWDSTRPTV